MRTLSLMVVTFTYLLIGAAVFDALEGPNNERAFEALQNVRGQFVREREDAKATCGVQKHKIR